MSDTHVPTDLDDFDRALLGSARSDEPASGAAARAAAALGLAAVTAPAAAAAAVAATGAAGRAAAFSFSKWTLIGALGVAGAGTGTVAYLGVTRSAAPTATGVAPASPNVAQQATHAQAPVTGVTPPAPVVAPPPATEVAPAAPAAPAARAVPASNAVPASPSPAVAPPLPATPHATSTSAAPSTPEATTAPPATAAVASPTTKAAPAPTGAVSIAEEVALVDRARHALKQGRAGEAFDTLSLYQSRWPNGVLATEVRVLRVEALLRLGQRASAVSDARAFIVVQPNSRYAARLRELFAPGELD